jgi:hypothetical protein
VGWANQLPNLKKVEFYFKMPLSAEFHNVPVAMRDALGRRRASNTNSGKVSRLLQEERVQMRPLADALRALFSQADNLQLYRMFFWRATVSYETIDMDEELELALPKLLQRRTIGCDMI